MKFLIDENLPPALARWLNSQGHDVIHVSQRNLLGGSDTAIVAAALAETRIILTRDADFDTLHQTSDEPKVLRLACGNCRNAELLIWLAPRLEAALEMLGRSPFVVLE